MTTSTTQPRKMYRIGTQSEQTGLAVSTLYAHIASGLWPKMISLGPRARALPSDEFDAMMAARTAGRSEDEIRELVLTLTAARQSA